MGTKSFNFILWQMVRTRSTSARCQAPAPAPASRAIARDKVEGEMEVGKESLHLPGLEHQQLLQYLLGQSLLRRMFISHRMIRRDDSDRYSLIMSGSSQTRVGGQTPDQQTAAGPQFSLHHPGTAVAPRIGAFQNASAGGTFQKVVDAAKSSTCGVRSLAMLRDKKSRTFGSCSGTSSGVRGFSAGSSRPPSGKPIQAPIQS
ncbi:hypothetical protein HAX54_053525, partial [Datura stramonium]|nr:hypothetical protein [Datura stramonium]